MPDLEAKVLKIVHDHLDAAADEVPDEYKPRLTMCIELLDAVLGDSDPAPAARTENAA